MPLDQNAFCLQEHYAPLSRCFGCGPSNPQGLRVQSYVVRGVADAAHAEWKPEPHHEAFPGILSGGIIGTLLDCHSNWTAAWFLMTRAKLEKPPCTVTADYAIRLLRPTPTEGLIQLASKVSVSRLREQAGLDDSREDRATVEASLTAGGKVCATCIGTFVAVKPGHPAYHRW